MKHMQRIQKTLLSVTLLTNITTTYAMHNEDTQSHTAQQQHDTQQQLTFSQPTAHADTGDGRWATFDPFDKSYTPAITRALPLRSSTRRASVPTNPTYELDEDLATTPLFSQEQTTAMQAQAALITAMHRAHTAIDMSELQRLETTAKETNNVAVAAEQARDAYVQKLLTQARARRQELDAAIAAAKQTQVQNVSVAEQDGQPSATLVRATFSVHGEARHVSDPRTTHHERPGKEKSDDEETKQQQEKQEENQGALIVAPPTSLANRYLKDLPALILCTGILLALNHTRR